MPKKKAKLFLQKQQENHFTLDQITEYLKNNFASYVLLTCSEPSDKGEMQADFSYAGDETLVSYLVDNAQAMLQETQETSQDLC